MRLQDTLDVRLKRRFHLRFRVFKKLLPRTVSDNSSQAPLQPSSSRQKLQTFGTLANTFSFTARAVIDDSLSWILTDWFVKARPPTTPF
jgi:hypothetical protein